MPKIIKYQQGQLIGDFGVIFNCDVKSESKKRKAEFKCPICRNHFVSSIDQVKSGKAKSCGCLRVSTVKRLKTKHGLARKGKVSRLWNVWQRMKQRCNNPNDGAYHNYGGRGISVCCEWEESFDCFKEWALSNGYSDELEIDRKNNNKGYFPGNCRFVTTEVNSRNRRNRRDNVTGISGIAVRKDNGKYRVCISDKCKKIDLGTYKDFFEACCARKSAENRYWKTNGVN